MRPVCPDCKRELVFVAIDLEDSTDFFRSWQCDCDYRDAENVPPRILATILRAREDDDAGISYQIGNTEDDCIYGNI